MALSVEKWVGFGSAMAGFGLLWSRMPEHVHDEARHIISSLVPMAMSYFNPYEQITISEYGEERFRRNKMFDAVSTYLRRACLDHASKLKAELGNNSKDDPLISLDENQEVVDNFDGARMWWRLCPKSAKNRGATVISFLPGDSDEPRCYRLVFHKRHRKLVLDSYLPSVVRQWRELIATNRQRLLFTNYSQQVGKSEWINVPYNPPATFDMLAMEHSKKVEIMEDLTAFREAKEYHSKVGKAWKRGYLLHGPPGTGKSTMIGAMANFLEYDVYDLDLTSIKDNAELRKLFLDTTDRSIIVIEDIDAIEVELTTKRKGKEAAEENDGNHVMIEVSDKNNKGKVTLSGLLSFVDGLWSACGSERIFVFTTNHVDRLDPALIRRGRMDRHIEMSYCRFEAFKMLAKSYLDITEHSLFGEIGQLLDEIDTTPADVADNLMPRGKRNGEIDRLLDEMNGAPADVAGNLMLRVKRRREADDCLAGLVETLKKAKMKSAAPPMDSMEETKEE
ncbi:AAA-ATPase At3g28580-like [Miscanthus floridulus]|uniref:AAA-ATPase At3g28580-like n=1 Tax=Miscanthus floridulus TaxID=154761 RepID=UPI00345B2CE6